MVYQKCDLKGPSYVDNKYTYLGFIVCCIVYGLGKAQEPMFVKQYVYIYICTYYMGECTPWET